jgi:tRNA (guanosine-2'-O-)-methyltransferase
LNLRKYNTTKENTLSCYQHLREQGYRIVATTPHMDDILLNELDLDQKTAIVFGTELEGLSTIAIENADAWMKIPMYGFTESFNISVSAAITLHHLTGKLRRSDIDWHLNETDRIETRLQWARSVVKHADKHERAFLEKEGLS